MSKSFLLIVLFYFFISITFVSGGTSKTSKVPEHIVVVIMSSMGYSEIKDNSQAPYINSLLPRGAYFTDSHGMDSYMDQPNYLYLFSGTNHQVVNDVYPPAGSPFSYPNLYTTLATKNLSFCGYSESLNYTGDTSAGEFPYSPIHNPWSLFTNVPANSNMPFDPAVFSGLDFPHLMNVSFVVPNLQNDMKNGTIAQGDRWLQTEMRDFIDYASSHNSLFVLTWDCQHGGSNDQVLTVLIGGMVKPGTVVSHKINHLSILQMITRMYSVPLLGASGSASPIPSSVWLPPYTLPPLPSETSSSAPAKSSPSGMSGLLIFITIVFSLAGFLLLGFFTVFFYRKWRESKTKFEVIAPQEVA